jgi:sulfonate transport system permease protein
VTALKRAVRHVPSRSDAQVLPMIREVPPDAADTDRGDAGTPAAAAAVVTDATAAPVSHDAAPEAAPTPEWVTRLQKSLVHWGIRIAALAAGVAFWHYACTNNLTLYIRFENVPGPVQVWHALLDHLREMTFYMHIGVSLWRIAISYALACAIGIPLGLLMGRSQLIRDIVSPYIELLRPIPAVAWIPLAILLLPTEEGSIIYITFLGALFPIVLNTVHGVEQTPEVLVRAAQTLGASKLTIFRHVVLPGALPSICAGLAVGMGVSWFSLLAGEIISGQYGIGYFTWNAYSIIHYPDIVVGMLAIGLLGTSSTALVRLITRPALRWQRKAR